jgi:ABC-type transport system involved in multi-copper enzyme maturation permease subunit
MTAPRIWGYASWVTRDYFLWGGVATYVLLVAVGAFFSEGLLQIASLQAGKEVWSLSPAQLRGLASQLMVALSLFGPLIATIEMVSRDRRFGYYRFLFSRPISPARYYASVFAINGIGFLVVAAILWTTFAIFLGPLPIGGYLLAMALSYAFIGAIVFLISTITRHDLLIGFLLYLVASITWDVLDNPTSTGWVVKARPIMSLLPPVKKHLEIVLGTQRPEYAVSWLGVVWVLGYGLACAAAATLLLRKRPLGGAP